MAISSGLVVPIVLWGNKCPRNQISHVSCLMNGKIIVTGTTEGQVIQWVVDESLAWIQPQMMMLSHETGMLSQFSTAASRVEALSAISCISPASYSSTSTKYLTCSQDGHICLWDSQDGRVVESVRGNYIHRKIIPHSSKIFSSQPSDNYLFCIGDYAEIAVMDAQDLNILFWLSSRVEPDWISTMTMVHPSDKHDVVIGVSVSGMIKLWSLNDLDKKEPGHVIYEDESKTMTSQSVQFIACSHLNTRMMLVICLNSWQIVDPSNLKQLIISECAIEGIQGCIIDIDRVAIGFADSTIVLFQLPRSKLVGKQIRERFGDSPANMGNIDLPFVFALVKGISSSPATPLWSTVQFHFDTRTSSDGRRRRVAYRVDQHGSLSVWHIPKNYDLLVSEFIRSRKPVVYEPTIRQSFGEVWNRLSPSPPTICGTEDDHLITATIYVGNQGKLFFGREDGSILMMNACHAIMNQLLDNPNTESVNHRVLCGHSAAVNCFLYPHKDSTRYDSHILLSGGADFAVVVWNITTGLKLHRFCCQGGPVLRMLVPPPNCNPRVLHTICAIAGDNSACLLSLKENKCILLASRQQFPIIDVQWRPLDDFMLLRCEDDSVYVWEIETSNLDRIVTGVITEDVMEACKEQIGLMDAVDEAGASQAVQMFRALKNKNVAAIKKIAAHGDDKNSISDIYATSTGLLPPMDVVQLKKCSDQAHLVLFNVDNLISGLLSLDYELSSHPSYFNDPNSIENRPSLSTLMSKKAEQHLNENHLPLSNVNTGLLNNSTHSSHSNSVSPKSFHSSNTVANNSPVISQRWQTETGLYMETARLLLSLLHAWNMDEDLDPICLKNLKLLKPKVPICYGTISRNGHISLYMPYCTGKLPALNDLSYQNFSKNIRWQQNKALTTVHLLSVIALSNTLMSFRSRHLHLTAKRPALRKVSSTKSTDSTAESESQQMKQGWSNVAALHCVLLPDLVKPSTSYAAPRIDLLARRWQDNCIEIRDAAQALLIRELERIGPQVVGRRKLADSWALFLPTLLDPSLSIFGTRLNSSSASYTSSSSSPVGSQLQQQASSQFIVSTPPTGTPPGLKTSKPVPPVPPRHPNASTHLPAPLEGVDTSSKSWASSSTNSSNHLSGNASANNNVRESSSGESDSSRLILEDENDKAGGIHQVRRNQATAIIVLGVMGAEFPIDLQSNVDLARATSHSLLELLVAGESPLLPLNSPLRRAAIDLLGRGFVVWQPHLDISKVLLGLLDLAAAGDKHLPAGEHFGAPLTPAADACRTARHSLSLIASARPQALITALSTEVARYNSAAQHQTIQHTVISPLLKSRMEVLRLIEQLSDKQYNCVAELIVPVGDILVHCLDTSLLKTRTLAEVFPPIAKFYMIAYCPATRRIAFGGKNGAIIVHELRASKAQTIQAHNSPITALAFSQDGKYLAAYSSQDAKISFWQTQQSFLGLTQSGIKCVKTLPAPSEFPVISPGGSYQQFRARLVWINNKSVTLMLPNGKENRFSV